MPRPIRPAGEYVQGISLQHQPATEAVTLKPINPEAQLALIARLETIPPERR